MSSLEIRTEHITKDYPGTRALDDVSLGFDNGRVHALVGKNGSGKSTLVKIFAGVIKPTAGDFFLNDEKLHFNTTSEAYEKGIVTVYQEMSLVPGLSVAENIFLGRLPKRNNMVDWRRTYQMAAELLARMKVDINPREMVSRLSMWQSQVIEITKALSFNPKVIMLDEPTSALAQHEVQSLFEAVRALRDQGVIVIYITHKLQELPQIADTVTVLRDGRLIGCVNMSEVQHKDIINMMFGEVKVKSRPKDIQPTSEVVMEVNGLSREGWYQNVSFKLYRGEILGIAGMLGSGRTELLKGIFGADPPQQGEVIVEGHSFKKTNLIKMKSAGVGLTPENRKKEGLILVHTIEDNLCYASMNKTADGWVENKRRRAEFAERQVEELQIKVPRIDALASSLSGGNQQKVVVGNWLNTSPKIMLFDEPSRGIDVNSKQQIFEIMWAQARKGISTVFVSTELEELLEVCHRILIIRHGRIVDEVDPDALNVNELYELCMQGD
ncbi:MAG TPA: sugar ABC transporter ATP-binding protein [Anaerolineaceae bacterium]|nr:sugar ABC transporter ATP-binding protein [Anaerolineaceae bacterium]